MSLSRAALRAAVYLAGIPVLLLCCSLALDPYTVSIPDALRHPGILAPMGTDALGRSNLARVILGMGLSCATALVALAVGLILAVCLGGLAGVTQGRWPDRCVRGLIAVLYTLPFFLLVVAVAGLIGLPSWTIPILVGAVIWPPAARLVRAEVLRVTGARFVLTQRAFGLPGTVWWWRSVVPLTLAPALATLVALVPEIVTIDVALAFFGLGVQPPTPTLGRLIYEGLSRFQAGWWLTVVPALALLGYCLGAHAVHAALATSLRRAART